MTPDATESEPHAPLLEQLGALVAGVPAGLTVTISADWLREELARTTSSRFDELSALGADRARLTLDCVFAAAEAGLVYVAWMRTLGFAPNCPGTPWADLCGAVDRLQDLLESRRSERRA